MCLPLSQDLVPQVSRTQNLVTRNYVLAMIEIVQTIFPNTDNQPNTSPQVNMPVPSSDYNSDNGSDSDSHVTDDLPVFLASRGPIVDVSDYFSA